MDSRFPHKAYQNSASPMADSNWSVEPHERLDSSVRLPARKSEQWVYSLGQTFERASLDGILVAPFAGLESPSEPVAGNVCATGRTCRAQRMLPNEARLDLDANSVLTQDRS